MKKRKLTRKLDLNKSLIARLNNNRLGSIKGGTGFEKKTDDCTTYVDMTMQVGCDTYTTFSNVAGLNTCRCTEPTVSDVCTSN